MNQVIAVALGGAVGALLRAYMTSGVNHLFGRGFPYGTLAVNIIGSAIIGYLFVLFIDRHELNLFWRPILITGLLGAFTTFSTFSLETLLLLEERAYMKASLNVVLSVGLCLFATALAMWLARQHT